MDQYGTNMDQFGLNWTNMPPIRELASFLLTLPDSIVTIETGKDLGKLKSRVHGAPEKTYCYTVC